MCERRLYGLYAITDSGLLPPARLLSAVAQAIAGGARLVQYRDKSAAPAERLSQAHALAELCRRHDVVFIVNDDLGLARSVGADGVHLGRDDADPRAARTALGSDAIIGVSCYDQLDRARRAADDGASYVAFGRFFPSRTKPHAVQAHVDLLRQARAELPLPIAAIGGITPANGGILIEAGAAMLAVVRGLFADTDVRGAAARYAALLPKPHGLGQQAS